MGILNEIFSKPLYGPNGEHADCALEDGSDTDTETDPGSVQAESGSSVPESAPTVPER